MDQEASAGSAEPAITITANNYAEHDGKFVP